jgi:AcrR family transcriptional regulator
VTQALRERNKARRRAAIQQAGMRLFAERGYDGATIADVAEVAEVAPRTVSMYFPTKLDLALSVSTETANRLADTIRADTRASFLDAVDRWLGEESRRDDPELLALAAAMFAANPSLLAASNSRLAEVMQVGEAALRRQLGLPADDPILHVVEAAVGAAIGEYLARLAHGGPVAARQQQLMRVLRAMVAAAG